MVIVRRNAINIRYSAVDTIDKYLLTNVTLRVYTNVFPILYIMISSVSTFYYMANRKLHTTHFCCANSEKLMVDVKIDKYQFVPFIHLSCILERQMTSY